MAGSGDAEIGECGTYLAPTGHGMPSDHRQASHFLVPEITCSWSRRDDWGQLCSEESLACIK